MVRTYKIFFLLVVFELSNNLSASSCGKPPLAQRRKSSDSKALPHAVLAGAGIATHFASPVTQIAYAACASTGFGCGSPAPLSPVVDGMPQEWPGCMFGSHYQGAKEVCDGTCDTTGSDLPRYYCAGKLGRGGKRVGCRHGSFNYAFIHKSEILEHSSKTGHSIFNLDPIKSVPERRELNKFLGVVTSPASPTSPE